MPPSFRARVVEVITNLGSGEVVSYGDVAGQAGFPGAARGVGSVLASSDGLPWWRVVMSDGRLAPGRSESRAGACGPRASPSGTGEWPGTGGRPATGGRHGPAGSRDLCGRESTPEARSPTPLPLTA